MTMIAKILARIDRIVADEMRNHRYASVDDGRLAMAAAIKNGLREDDGSRS